MMYKLTQNDNSVLYVDSDVPVQGGLPVEEVEAEKVRKRTATPPQPNLADIQAMLAALQKQKP